MSSRSTNGRRQLAVAAAVAAAIAAPTLFLGTSAASTSRHHQHFTAVSHDALGSITPPDFGANPVQNQQAAEDAPLTRGGRTVGRTETVVTVTRVSAHDVEGMVECTVKLPGGTIFFNGAVDVTHLATGVTVPVVGGTGAYEGAAGTVVMEAPTTASTKLTFDFTTP
jgi:hypothetical protein